VNTAYARTSTLHMTHVLGRMIDNYADDDKEIERDAFAISNI
jgi:hypothetical protein